MAVTRCGRRTKERTDDPTFAVDIRDSRECLRGLVDLHSLAFEKFADKPRLGVWCGSDVEQRSANLPLGSVGRFRRRLCVAKTKDKQEGKHVHFGNNTAAEKSLVTSPVNHSARASLVFEAAKRSATRPNDEAQLRARADEHGGKATARRRRSSSSAAVVRQRLRRT